MRHRTDRNCARVQAPAMSKPMPSIEQRVYDAADNAYLSEGGHLAPIGNDAAQAACDTAEAGLRRGNEQPLRTGPTPEERTLMGHFGVTHSGRVYRYAQRSYDHFYDALVRAWAAAKRPH